MPLDKMEQDFSAQVDEALPKNKELALNVGKLSEAIENLLALEKQSRQANDTASTKRIAVGIVQLCKEAGDWKSLNNQVTLLSKRRGQMKAVVTAVVQEGTNYLEEAPDKEAKMALLDTLRTVTAGKIYVEVERARLTRMLASIKEAEGDIDEAATVLQAVQVETFGQMDKREKADYLLEQVRLCLDKKDYIRAKIISNKVSDKMLADKEFQDIKLRYHTLMIRYFTYKGEYLNVSRAYRAMFDTPKVQDDDAEAARLFKQSIIFLALAPHDNEQHDLLHRFKLEKVVKNLPQFSQVLIKLTTMELISWASFRAEYEECFKHESLFNGSDNEKYWGDLQSRIVEHNLRVIEKYYSRIPTARLCELLELSDPEVEKHLSKLVVDNKVYARIDRPAGIVSFSRPKTPSELLNDWAGNVTSLLTMLDHTTHLLSMEVQNFESKKLSA